MTLSSLIPTDIAFKHSIRVNAMSDLEQYLATLEKIRHKHQVHQIDTINFEEACSYRGLHTFWRISETDRVPRRSKTDGRQRKTRINNELKRGVFETT